MSKPRVRVSNTWLKLLTLQGGSLPILHDPLPGAHVPDCLSSLPTRFSEDVSHRLEVYRSLSASLWLVFSKNYSTCICIFDVEASVQGERAPGFFLSFSGISDISHPSVDCL